jgi:hypothetical protein
MQKYVVSPKEDYNKKVKLSRKFEVECYSPSQMRDMYPHGGYKVVAEAADYSVHDEFARFALAEDASDEQTWKLNEPGAHGKVLHKRAGYAIVKNTFAEGAAGVEGSLDAPSYVVLLKSRKPLAIWLICLTLLLALTLLSLLWMQDAQGEPEQDIYNPLPAVDVNEESLGEDTSEQAASQNGGGAVSLRYSLNAELDLSTGEIQMYFANPSKSNHAVVLELYVVDGEGARQGLLATSGLIEPGNSLSKMQFLSSNIKLSDGTYEAKFGLAFYDPQTGEKALVETNIDDVELVVTN